MATKKMPWWKKHEELVSLFESAMRPLDDVVKKSIFQKDVVDISRQLDVGIFSNGNANNLKSFVEVQKRNKKVGIEDFGAWIYKKETLKVKEFAVVSEAGFTRAVVAHVRQLHPNGVVLGRLHAVPDGLLKVLESTVTGLSRIESQWMFAAVIVGYSDQGGMEVIVGDHVGNGDIPIFSDVTPMSLVNFLVQENGLQKDGLHAHRFTMPEGIYRAGRPVYDVVVVAELRTRIWDTVSEFYSYEEVFPNPSQRGLAHLSKSNLGNDKILEATLIMIPIIDELSGRECKILGQFKIKEIE